MPDVHIALSLSTCISSCVQGALVEIIQVVGKVPVHSLSCGIVQMEIHVSGL